ncbi:MAG: transketolase family protein [Neisseriaceae bacterium]
MRKEFVTKVLELMQQDENIIFLTGDLGFGSFEIIEEQYKNRFYNVGIAEQNMIGLACGLGLAGKKIIIYSIANFTTLRVLEQIRNYLIYHDTKALIVNGGGGFCYGQLGYTHHAVEDVSIMKSLPYIEIYAPYNCDGISNAMDKWAKEGKVSYLRLEKSIVQNLDTSVNVQKLSTFTEIIGNLNSSNFIITYGTILNEAIKVKSILSNIGIDIGIIVLTSIKHIDDVVLKKLNNKNIVAFLEENTISGGLGEQFFAKCMLNNIKFKQSKIFAVNDFISKVIGDQDYMRDLHGLSAKYLVEYFKTKI